MDHFGPKNVCHYENFENIALVTFFASSFYTFWPKISFLAPFLKSWSILDDFSENAFKLKPYGQTLVFTKFQTEISWERKEKAPRSCIFVDSYKLKL